MIDNNKKTHLIVTGRGGGGTQVQADWNQTDTEQPDYIKNKPELATVATSGSYNDLTDKPTIPTQVQADWNETDTTDPSYIQNKPTILTQWFGTQAEYDLIDPKDPNTVYHIEGGAPVQSNWNESDNTSLAYIQNKPTIPAAQVNSDWNANSGVAQILNKPTLATVATTGSYNDLTDKPTVTQEQADWNQSDNTQVDYIKNKPTIPTVPAMATETLTFTLQGGTTKTVEFYTVPNYFYVEDISGSDNTLSITKSNDSAPTIEVFKSTDMMNWTSMGSTSTTPITTTIPANGKLYLKATTNAWGSNPYTVMGNKITASGNHNIGGNIMSLLYGDNFSGKTILNNNAFSLLFRNDNKLVNVSDLELPATTMTKECYYGMFAYCSSLTTAPALPATTLANNCYYEMFNNTAITQAPALPVTTLATGCYYRMFNGCESLTTAPVLPATTLANGCYQEMFYGCNALTTAPALPATTLTNWCYNEMFNQCRNLNKVTTYAQDISASDCLTNWLCNVAATGDFYNLGGATYTSGASGIPTGWTEHTSL